MHITDGANNMCVSIHQSLCVLCVLSLCVNQERVLAKIMSFDSNLQYI